MQREQTAKSLTAWGCFHLFFFFVMPLFWMDPACWGLFQWAGSLTMQGAQTGERWIASMACIAWICIHLYVFKRALTFLDRNIKEYGGVVDAMNMNTANPPATSVLPASVRDFLHESEHQCASMAKKVRAWQHDPETTPVFPSFIFYRLPDFLLVFLGCFCFLPSDLLGFLSAFLSPLPPIFLQVCIWGLLLFLSSLLLGFETSVLRALGCRIPSGLRALACRIPLGFLADVLRELAALLVFLVDYLIMGTTTAPAVPVFEPACAIDWKEVKEFVDGCPAGGRFKDAENVLQEWEKFVDLPQKRKRNDLTRRKCNDAESFSSKELAAGVLPELVLTVLIFRMNSWLLYCYFSC